MIYPSAPIEAADEAVAIKRKIDKGIDAVKIMNPDSGAMADKAAFMKETYTDALVVIHGDRIVYEKYFNGMHADQPHQMMSVTKSFAGLLGMMAVDDGKLNEADPVTRHVPELKTAGAFADATFGQVLDMTNSMEFTEDYADPRSGIRQYGAVIGWTDREPGIEYADSLYDYLVTLPIDKDHGHGEIFHYQTPKTDVVNWIINRVNGHSFEDAMHAQLWSKLGTGGETYVLLDGNATLVAGGGLNATPDNLARFATMMINDGKFSGKQVVQPAIIDTLARGGSIEAFSRGPDAKDAFGNGDWSYRAQWWVRHTPDKEAFTAIGIHGQWIYLDVDRNVAIIKQSSQPVSHENFYDEFNLNAFDAIISQLTRS